jgi:hypothetical protein
MVELQTINRVLLEFSDNQLLFLSPEYDEFEKVVENFPGNLIRNRYNFEKPE